MTVEKRRTLKEITALATEHALVSNRPMPIYRRRNGSFSLNQHFAEGSAELYKTIPAGGAEHSIEELRRYILDKYEGRIVDALETIGGIRLVRSILGWGDNSAVLDPSLYVAPGSYESIVPNFVSRS